MKSLKTEEIEITPSSETSSGTSSYSRDNGKPEQISPAQQAVVISETRKRRSAEEKLALVRLTYLPGNTVSSVARQHGVSPALMFKWRAQEKSGQLTSRAGISEKTVPASQYADAMEEIKRLQRLLGRAVSDNALLTEAVEMMSGKKWNAR